MTLLIYQLINEYIPIKRKTNAKGWTTFNSTCCHHRGHNQDTRGRGNLLAQNDGSIVYNCYNCGFKAGFKGIHLSNNFEKLLSYLGIPIEKIQQIKIELLSKKLKGDSTVSTDDIEWFQPEHFNELELPTGAKTIERCLNNKSSDFLNVKKYLLSRGRAVVEGHQYYWTQDTKWDFNHRIIIPFYYKNKIVGWTGRYAGKNPIDVPRYFNSEISDGYLFNADILFNRNRKYILVTEGPFDAIAVNGISALGSTLNQSQINWLNSFEAEKIIVPDRQQQNQELIDTALEQNWFVSYPDWEGDVKDSAEASKRYGKLYTIYTIINARTNNNTSINLRRKLFKG